MKLVMTLSEVQDLCTERNWDKFCEDYGFSQYAVMEGGGDIEITMSPSYAKSVSIMEFPEELYDL